MDQDPRIHEPPFLDGRRAPDDAGRDPPPSHPRGRGAGHRRRVAYAIYRALDRERAERSLEGALNADYQILPDYLPEIAAHATILRPLLEKIENDPSTSLRTTARSPGSCSFATGRRPNAPLSCSSGS